jgi:hypothetical protein
VPDAAPDHHRPGLCRHPAALWSTGSETGKKGDNQNERKSRNASSEAQSRADGRYNRSHRPRPWPLSSPSVAYSAFVRGLCGPETGCPRTHSGRRRPGSASRSASALVSRVPLSQGRRAVKPSAQPTLVRTQHLPHCFRRSKPVSLDGGTGFLRVWASGSRTVVKVFWASRGPDQTAHGCSILVLLWLLNRKITITEATVPVWCWRGLRAVSGRGGKVTDV